MFFMENEMQEYFKDKKKNLCKHLDHELEFQQNSSNRSIWKCKDCGAIIYRNYNFKQGEVSDGYHTFNELYHHRAVLFATICNKFKSLAWKSKMHDDGSMFDDMFIVGIDTPFGQATYHYDIDPYWDKYFGNIKEIEKAPKWDGHTPSQAIERIFSLSNVHSDE